MFLFPKHFGPSKKPQFLRPRYGTLKLKGLECEVLSYVEWMDRPGCLGFGETQDVAVSIDGWFAFFSSDVF